MARVPFQEQEPVTFTPKEGIEKEVGAVVRVVFKPKVEGAVAAVDLFFNQEVPHANAKEDTDLQRKI